MNKPNTDFEFITEWAKKASVSAKKQGRNDAAKLWEDCIEHLFYLKDIVDRQWVLAEDEKPKLYSKVLVKLINGAEKKRKALAEYIPEKTVRAEDFMHDYWTEDHPDEEYAPAGWYEMTEEHEVQYPLSGEITHWMALES